MIYKRTETVDRIVATKTLHENGLEKTMTKTFHVLEQVGHILFWARDAVKLEISPDEVSIRKLTEADETEHPESTEKKNLQNPFDTLMDKYSK